MNIRKGLALLLTVTLAAALFAACGSPSTPPSSAATEAPASSAATEAPASSAAPASGDKKQVVVWHYFTEVVGEEFPKILSAYNATQDEVEVVPEFLPREELLKKLTIGMVADELPDITMIDNPDHPPFSAMGILANIRDKFDAWEDSQYFLPGPLAMCEYEGGLYGLPMRPNCLAFWLNWDILNPIGITEFPETWDDLLEISAIIKEQTDVYPLSLGSIKTESGAFQQLPWIYSAGGDPLQPTSEGTIKAFDFLSTMYQNGYISQESLNWHQTDAMKQFAAGNAAMMVGGCWHIANMAVDAPDMNYGISYIPRDKEHASAFGGEDLCIIADSEYIDESWEFFKWFFDPSVLNDFDVVGTTLSPRSDVDPAELYPDSTDMQLFAEIMTQVKPRGPHPKYSELSAILQVAYQEIYTGSKTVEQALNDAETQMAEIR